MEHKTKTRKIKKKFLGIRVPKDYPWLILDALASDLRQFITEDNYALISAIIRQRDIVAYDLLDDIWGLQCIASSGGTGSLENRSLYQLASLLRKCEDISSDSDKRLNAEKKFFSAENDCFEYNHKGYLPLINGSDVFLTEALTYARAFIQKTIGSSPPDFEHLTLWSRHGPGATLDTYKSQTSLYDKYMNWPYSCTNQAFGHAIKMICSDERWLGALEDSYRAKNNIPMHSILSFRDFWPNVIKIVDFNKITFVPKSYKIHRTIAIEPTMNLFLQLGVDGFFRKRLKYWGVNLNSQVRNQQLARQGSIKDDLATLDLSAASDTVSLRICQLLLPPEWYSYLNDLRSPKGRLDKLEIHYNKISSMGNGYTFALESLIFASLLYATERFFGHKGLEQCAVYGDDLILPKSHVDLFKKLLYATGFKLNTDKSFINGNIRESCGTDWIHGLDVRPIMLHRLPTSVKDLFSDLNRLNRWSYLLQGRSLEKVSSLIDKWIPYIYKNIKGPFSDYEFDTYLHSSLPCYDYKNSVYKFKRLIFRYSSRNADSFLFRKLMAPLRSSTKSASMSGGSCFSVENVNSRHLAYAPSVTSLWSSEYTACLPVKYNFSR